MKFIKYRIVKDRYAGFECQIWKLWFPFWVQMDFVNTHDSLQSAIDYIKIRNIVVWKSK